MTDPRDPDSAARAEADLAAREDPYNVSEASRIYLLPNLMTAGNLACGFVSIICCIRANYEMRIAGVQTTSEIPMEAIEQFRWAVWMIFAAAGFDVLDGRLARLGGRESLFGAEFDSLADVVSFGLAPALMVFFLILSPTQGYPFFLQIGGFLSFVYLLCAAIRLARFNVITNPLLQKNVKDTSREFVGLPVPAAAATVAALVLALLNIAGDSRDLHFRALFLPPLMVLVAVLMISSVRYPSIKNFDLQTRLRVRPFLGIVVAGGAIWIIREFGILLCVLAYVFFGLFRHIRRNAQIRHRRKTL
jgi:CDP-diacylglycerol--serine O-phosphatidyltransferase